MIAATTTSPITIAPCSPKAEAKAIGAMLHGPDRWGDPVAEVMAILPPDIDCLGGRSWFYEQWNSEVYKAIYEIYRSGDPVTIDTVCGYLDRTGWPYGIGPDYIEQVYGSVVSAASAKAEAREVREKAIQRWTWEIGNGVQWGSEDPNKSTAENIQEAIARLSRIASLTTEQPGPGWLTIGEVGQDEHYNKGLSQISTGYDALDRALKGGFRAESVYPLAGRTGSAKSTLALNMARREAIQGYSVLFFKLEESLREANYRLHAAAAKVRLKVLLDGAENAGQGDQERLADSWEVLQDLPIRLADCRNIDAIERISQKHVAAGGQIIFVDQLSMVEVPDTAIGYERATAVSNRLRLLARDLRVPIVVVCQVNRPASKDAGHLSCHDLRDSGAIENDAAAVLLIDGARDPDGPQYSGCDPIKYLQVIVGKNRYGARTDPDKPIELLWYPTICRIDDTDFDGGAE